MNRVRPALALCAIASSGMACFPAPPCEPDAAPPACRKWSTESCGWVSVDDGASCEDGNLCTNDDQCRAGLCKGSPIDCSDERTCTVDLCSAADGSCTHDASDCACARDTECNDSKSCTTDTCEVGIGRCVHTPQSGTSCDDLDACTTDDTCRENGICLGAPLPCDDGRACTVDTCLQGVCSHDASICACTTASDCDDNNPCTDDDCSAADGRCLHAPRNGPCDDGNPCTVGDACEAASCVAGPEKTCVAGVCVATAQCDQGTGACVTTPTQDGNPCDSGQCVSGSCVPVPNGMALVPAGTSKMGDASNGPIHLVEAPSYFVDLHEVTASDFAQCVSAQACERPDYRPGSSQTYGVDGLEDHPVNLVDWQQAVAFCTWMDRRLCSEAEWEKAAHGGCEFYDDCLAETPRYPWGAAPATCSLAIFKGPNYLDPAGCGTVATWTVGSVPAGQSPYGALDMIGNVAEWVADCWHGGYGGAPPDGSAWIVGCESVFRVVRGGHWASTVGELSTAARTAYAPITADYYTGFRCCKDATP